MNYDYNYFKNLKYKQTKQKIGLVYKMQSVLWQDYIIKKNKLDNLFISLSNCESIAMAKQIATTGENRNAKIRIYAKNPENKEIGSIYGIRLDRIPKYYIYNKAGILINSGTTPVSSFDMNEYITIAPGAYSLKVSFNGIDLFENIIVTSGEIKTIIFNFIRKEIDMYGFIASCYSEIIEPYYRFNMVNSFDEESTEYFIQHMGQGIATVWLSAKPNGSYEGSAAINIHSAEWHYLPFLSTFTNKGFIEVEIDPPDEFTHFPTMEEYVLGESEKFHCSTIPYDLDGTAL